MTEAGDGLRNHGAPWGPVQQLHETKEPEPGREPGTKDHTSECQPQRSIYRDEQVLPGPPRSGQRSA